MISFDIVHVALALVALVAVGFALWARQAAAPELSRLGAELAHEREERADERSRAEKSLGELAAERDALRGRAESAERRVEAQEASLRERDAAFVRELARMEKAQAEAEARFKAIADAALLKSQEQFVQLADETLKKHKEGAQGEFGAMLKPVQEAFGQFREKVEAIEKARSEDRAKLDEQLRMVGETARLTQETTGKLATALSSTRGAGRWGEGTLRNVLELAGLSPHADFTEQTGATTETGRIRPDVIIAMPGGRHLVIDSKVSLEDYLAASEESDPQRRRARLVAHAARVKAHVTALSRKDYWKDIPDTVDFVVMFLPGENFYAAVLEQDREIFDYAWRNNVMIATPSTLIALAKSVAFGWRQEQMAKNAEQAVGLGRELHDRLARMCEHMARVGGGLGGAIKAYNDMVGSMETRVLPSARRFEELQVTDPSRTIADPPHIDATPRQLSFLELAAADGAKASVRDAPLIGDLAGTPVEAAAVVEMARSGRGRRTGSSAS